MSGWNASPAGYVTPPPNANGWTTTGSRGWGQPPPQSAPPSQGRPRRSRANSYSEGGDDGWDAVPGWSSRPDNQSGWNTPPGTPNHAHGGNAAPSWGGPGGARPGNASNNGRGGWNPGGWDPLPPSSQYTTPVSSPEPTGARPSFRPNHNAGAKGGWSVYPSSPPTSSDGEKGVKFAPQVEYEGRRLDESRLRKAKSMSGLDRRFRTEQGPDSADWRTAKVSQEGRGKYEPRPSHAFGRPRPSDGRAGRFQPAPPTSGPRQKRSNRNLKAKPIGEPAKAFGLYVYGFPKWVRVRDMIEVFSEYGPIANVGIVAKSRKNDQPHAYIDYEEAGSAQKATEALVDKTFFEMTKPLELRYNFERSDRSLLSKEEGEIPLDKTTLHVRNLPLHVEKADIEAVFGAFGELQKMHVVNRPRDNRAYAFIVYSDEASAEKALKEIPTENRFGMVELLKVEYATARDKKPEVAAAKPVKSKARSKTVYVNSVEEDEEGFNTRMKVFGDVKTCCLASYPDPAPFLKTNPDATLAEAGKYGLVVYDTPEEADKAVAAGNGDWPRGRRLYLSGLPTGSTINDIKGWFASECGEVKKIDFLPEDTSDKEMFAVIEFVRAPSAWRALVRAATVPLPFTKVLLKAAYYEDKKADAKAEAEEDHAEDDAPPSDNVDVATTELASTTLDTPADTQAEAEVQKPESGAALVEDAKPEEPATELKQEETTS